MPQTWQCELEVYKATYHFIFAQKNFFTGDFPANVDAAGFIAALRVNVGVLVTQFSLSYFCTVWTESINGKF